MQKLIAAPTAHSDTPSIKNIFFNQLSPSTQKAVMAAMKTDSTCYFPSLNKIPIKDGKVWIIKKHGNKKGLSHLPCIRIAYLEHMPSGTKIFLRLFSSPHDPRRYIDFVKPGLNHLISKNILIKIKSQLEINPNYLTPKPAPSHPTVSIQKIDANTPHRTRTKRSNKSTHGKIHSGIVYDETKVFEPQKKESKLVRVINDFCARKSEFETNPNLSTATAFFKSTLDMMTYNYNSGRDLLTAYTQKKPSWSSSTNILTQSSEMNQLLNTEIATLKKYCEAQCEKNTHQFPKWKALQLEIEFEYVIRCDASQLPRQMDRFQALQNTLTLPFNQCYTKTDKHSLCVQSTLLRLYRDAKKRVRLDTHKSTSTIFFKDLEKMIEYLETKKANEIINKVPSDYVNTAQQFKTKLSLAKSPKQINGLIWTTMDKLETLLETIYKISGKLSPEPIDAVVNRIKQFEAYVLIIGALCVGKKEGRKANLGIQIISQWLESDQLDPEPDAGQSIIDTINLFKIPVPVNLWLKIVGNLDTTSPSTTPFKQKFATVLTQKRMMVLENKNSTIMALESEVKTHFKDSNAIQYKRLMTQVSRQWAAHYISRGQYINGLAHLHKALSLLPKADETGWILHDMKNIEDIFMTKIKPIQAQIEVLQNATFSKQTTEKLTELKLTEKLTKLNVSLATYTQKNELKTRASQILSIAAQINGILAVLKKTDKQQCRNLKKVAKFFQNPPMTTSGTQKTTKNTVRKPQRKAGKQKPKNKSKRTQYNHKNKNRTHKNNRQKKKSGRSKK